MGTCVACPVWLLGVSLGRHKDMLLKMTLHLTLFGELRIPTPHAVCLITKPYISRIVFAITLSASIGPSHIVPAAA